MTSCAGGSIGCSRIGVLLMGAVTVLPPYGDTSQCPKHSQILLAKGLPSVLSPPLFSLAAKALFSPRVWGWTEGACSPAHGNTGKCAWMGWGWGFTASDEVKNRSPGGLRSKCTRMLLIFPLPSQGFWYGLSETQPLKEQNDTTTQRYP